MSKDAIADALRLARRKKKPVRFHHTIAREGYQDGGVPDEANQQAFLQKQLKGSAPQYIQESDFPARAAHAVETADRYAGKVNNMLADIAGQPEMRSPEGRRAAEIVTAPIPPDPNEVSKQAVQQYQSGDRLGAAETMMGGMPQTGIFVGERANLTPFERTEGERAKKLYADGLSREEILQNTGWFKNQTGKLKTEISDKDSKFISDGFKENTKLSDIFDHEKLYEKYPHIKDMLVVQDPDTKGYAYYRQGYGGQPSYIALHPDVISDPELARASLLHEIQHGIQMHEDWPHGASPSNPEYQKIPIGENRLTRALNRILGRYLDPEVAYGRSLGEREAKNVEWRSRLRGENLRYYDPIRTENHLYEDSLDGPVERFMGKTPKDNSLLVEHKSDRKPKFLSDYAKGGAVDDALRLARRGYATDGAVASQESLEEPEAQAYGEVSFAPEYTPRPQEEAKQPDDANQEAFIREGLKGSAPQYDPSVETGLKNAAIAGAKWTAPGAAADAMGMLGGPSMAENIRQGRYLPAAMQAVAVGLPTAMAGRAAINAGLGAGASKFTKLGKPDVFLAPGYVAEQTAEDWAPGVFGKKTYEGAKMAGKRAIEEAGDYIRKKIGYADGGEVDDALRIARQSGGKTPAWQRAEGKNPSGGLSAKGRASAKREGMNLKPPAPHPKTEKDAGRRKSFCARMSGMREKLTSAETARDPDSRINKSLRAWNCADGGAVEDAVKLAKGGKIWDKERPKGLGKPKKLSESQKSSAKAAAKAAGRPWPNMIDNINAAKKG